MLPVLRLLSVRHLHVFTVHGPIRSTNVPTIYDCYESLRVPTSCPPFEYNVFRATSLYYIHMPVHVSPPDSLHTAFQTSAVGIKRYLLLLLAVKAAFGLNREITKLQFLCKFRYKSTGNLVGHLYRISFSYVNTKDYLWYKYENYYAGAHSRRVRDFLTIVRRFPNIVHAVDCTPSSCDKQSSSLRELCFVIGTNADVCDYRMLSKLRFHTSSELARGPNGLFAISYVSVSDPCLYLLIPVTSTCTQMSGL